MPNFSKRTQLVLESVIGILLILIAIVAYFLFLKPVDPSQRVFKSPHGTVTYSERGGLGPQTSRDILLADKYAKADLEKDKSARKFVIEQSRPIGAIFIEKGCLLSPISTKWLLASPLKFINEDSVPHTISILSHTYQIAAGKDFEVPNAIPRDKILKLYCDTDKKVQGYIYFTN